MTDRDDKPNLDLMLWKWKPYGCRVAMSMGCPPHLVEDVVSEAVVWGLPYARKSDGIQSPHEAWCRNIMKWGVMRAYNKVKHTVRVPRTVEDVPIMVELDDLAAENKPIIEMIDIRNRVSKMTVRQQEIMHAFINNSGDMSETGRNLGISYQRVQRVLKILRDMDNK